jgi:hypothetical protein
MTIRMNPTQRAELHETAKSAVESGKHEGFSYKVMPKVNDALEISDARQAATTKLASVIFPDFAELVISFYHELVYRLNHMVDCRVLIKGSNALAILFMNDIENYKHFQFSDTDIVVYCSPENKDLVCTVIGQIIAKHKQQMDQTFFKQNESEFGKQFARKHIELFGDSSPFSSIEQRNVSSSYSYYITKSTADPEKIVKIIEPHFTRAERIPLNKTPIFCSVNDTLDGVDLYRLRWGIKENEKMIHADFIDVIVDYTSAIPQLQTIFRFGTFINIPDDDYLIKDLEMIVPILESKKESRMQKLKILCELLKKNIC